MVSICQGFPCLQDITSIYFYKVSSNGKNAITVSNNLGFRTAFLSPDEEVHTASTSLSYHLFLTKTGLTYYYKQETYAIDNYRVTLAPSPSPITMIVNGRDDIGSHIGLITEKELLAFRDGVWTNLPSPVLFDRLCGSEPKAMAITLSGDYYRISNGDTGSFTPLLNLVSIYFGVAHLSSQGRLFFEGKEIPTSLVIVDIAVKPGQQSLYCLSSEGKVYSVCPEDDWQLIERKEGVIGISYNQVYMFMH